MSECKKCNQKPTSKTQYFTIAAGFYLLGSSIYGTVKIFEFTILAPLSLEQAKIISKLIGLSI